MFDLGIQELLVIFIVALLVIGPKNLPELARKMGEGFGQLKKAIVDARQEIDSEMKGSMPIKLEDVPSWKSDDIKRAIQEKAIEAAGLKSPEQEEGGPRNAPADEPKDAETKNAEVKPSPYDAQEGDSGQRARGSDGKNDGEGQGRA